jgi:hypothetical protein
MRRLVWTGVGILVSALVVALAASAWVGVRSLDVRNRLLAARDGINVVRQDLESGADAAAAKELAVVQHDAAQAHSDSSDPAWVAVGDLPFLGRTVRTVRGIASGAHDLAQQVLPSLLTVGSSIAPSRLRVNGSTLDLAPLPAAARILARATALVGAQVNAASNLPASLVLSPVSKARRQWIAQLASLDGQLSDATRFAEVGPAVLGADGPRHYFVALQNNAEVRGTGGLVGAFAILTADHGHISLAQFGSDDDLVDSPTPVVDLGTQFTKLYGGYQSTQSWKSSNVSPQFPDAAAIWAGLWRAQTGQVLDGAIAVDPIALAKLLSVAGPVTLPEGTRLTGANTVSFLEQGIYREFPTDADDTPRKALLVAATQLAFDRVLSGSGAAQPLVDALASAAGTGDVLFWSAHPAEEAALTGTALAGELPDSTAPFDELVVNNDGGNKLDYYLRRSLEWTAGSCSGKTRFSTVTATLDNNAPVSGLPPYVTERFDHPIGPYPVGQNRLLVSIYTTDGTQLIGATLDGAVEEMSAGNEQGHAVFTADFTINPQQARTLILTLEEPTAHGTPTLRVQPMVFPQVSDISVPACG